MYLTKAETMKMSSSVRFLGNFAYLSLRFDLEYNRATTIQKSTAGNTGPSAMHVDTSMLFSFNPVARDDSVCIRRTAVKVIRPKVPFSC